MCYNTNKKGVREQDAQEKIYNYGRNRKPIGSYGGLPPPIACAGEGTAHMTEITPNQTIKKTAPHGTVFI